MLLFHKTCIEYILSIINDGKLKPSSKTKNKNENPYEKYLEYNFFNTIPKTKLNYYIDWGKQNVGIVFNSDVILNKIFYTNKRHFAGNLKTSEKYKIDNHKDLTRVLYKLYKESLKKVFKNENKINKEDFIVISIFQEVFTKYEPSLDDAKYIILPKKVNKKLITLIKKKYPNIEIIFNN